MTMAASFAASAPRDRRGMGYVNAYPGNTGPSRSDAAPLEDEDVLRIHRVAVGRSQPATARPPSAQRRVNNPARPRFSPSHRRTDTMPIPIIGPFGRKERSSSPLG